MIFSYLFRAVQDTKKGRLGWKREEDTPREYPAQSPLKHVTEGAQPVTAAASASLRVSTPFSYNVLQKGDFSSRERKIFPLFPLERFLDTLQSCFCFLSGAEEIAEFSSIIIFLVVIVICGGYVSRR